MVLCPFVRRKKPPSRRRLFVLLLAVMVVVLLTVTVVVVVVPSRIEPRHETVRLELELVESGRNETLFQVQGKATEWTTTTIPSSNSINDPSAVAVAAGPAAAAIEEEASSSGEQKQKQKQNPLSLSGGIGNGPYHNWELFAADYEEMLHSLKIFVYPDVYINSSSSPFAQIFLPHPNPFHPKLGNYFSEHLFKLALLRSSLVTPRPEEAHFFFMPFSINNMRNHPALHSETSISDFVAQYTARISMEFEFWNASGGTDHFYVCCHSVGREAASKHPHLHNNAIQVTCSSTYFQRLYIAHKDIGLPQVWPRQHEKLLNPPHARNKLVFFAGRMQNSRIRQELLATWGNDTDMDIFSGYPSFPYEEGFRRSRYCLHVKGYEVNTARVSDAIHYGCIPVLVSNYYDLPFANVLDWSKFSIIISQGDIACLKKILLSVSRQMYLSMFQNLRIVRRHFVWHTTPKSYDSFHMIAYQLWLRRGLHLAYNTQMEV